MQSRIAFIKEKKLIGKKLTMTMADNKTGELWRNFMSRRKEIKNNLSPDLISMQIFAHPDEVLQFNINNVFEKWATVEVSDFDQVPDQMETFLLPAGEYAVFHFKGNQSGAASAFGYIFNSWLPGSEYKLDDRPHFEVLGEKYKNGDPDSEEEIWIPVAPKV